MCEAGKGRLKVVFVTRIEKVEPNPERARSRLQVLRLHLRNNRIGRVEQQGDRARRRHKLVDQLQPFLAGIYV